MRAAFTAAGVNHVLSISGLHVAMLGLVVFGLVRYACACSVFLLLRWNLLKVATFCSFIAVVFYTALAGAMVPTVRSAIMIGVYELAVLLDREEEVFTSLTLAALLIALVWPGVIADIGLLFSPCCLLPSMRRSTRFFPRQDGSTATGRNSPIENIRRAGLHLLRLAGDPVLAHSRHYFGHFLGGFRRQSLSPLVGLF
jgi:ComEC/Rec2-related protein